MVVEIDLSVLLKNLNFVVSSENYVFIILFVDRLISVLILVVKGMF